MKLVPLSELFMVTYGTKLDHNKTIPYINKPILHISRKAINHGINDIVEYIPSITPNKAYTITVPLGGEGRLTAFLQFREYYNAQNIAILTPAIKMNVNQLIFYCISIRKNQYKYSAFGREANETIKQLLIPDISEIPSFVYETKIEKIVSQSNKRNDVEETEFALKPLTSLFEQISGGILSEEVAKSLDQGDVSFVTATTKDNGIKYRIDTSGLGIKPIIGPALSLAKNGNGLGTCFYQNGVMTRTSDVIILKPSFEGLNKYNGLFFKLMIEKNKYRFSYGRKINNDRLDEMEIMVPIRNGEIDLKYMEMYVKSFELSKLI